MTVMLEVLLSIVPVFLIIGVGTVVDRFHFLPAGSSSVLSAYLLRLGMPLVLLHIMAGADPATLTQAGYWIALIAAQGVVYAAGYGADVLLARRGQGPAAMTALASSCCNAAFLGLAIIGSLFPGNAEAMIAAGIATITPAIVLVTGQVHLEILRQRKEGQSRGVGPILVKSLLMNPMLWGISLGIVLCVTGIGLWDPLARAVGLVGSTCAPCALLALGLDMRARLNVAMKAKGHVALHQAGVISLKLIVHPLLAWALLALLGVSGLWLAVGVLMAGTASAVAVYMVGEYYRTAPEECAFSVVLTNCLNLFTMAGFAYAFRVLGYV